MACGLWGRSSSIVRMGSSDVGVGKRGADGDGWMDVFVYTRRGIVREVRDGVLAARKV